MKISQFPISNFQFLVGIAIIFIAIGFFVFKNDPTPASATWWNDSWSYRKALTINSAQVAGDLTDFPVLISLTDTDLSGHAQEDGDDFVFTLRDGSKLKHEIESYASSTGVLVAWVKVPSLSSTDDTDIFMYYGNAGASDQSASTEVWDENYMGVWHMNNEANASSTDSTVNNNDGTLYDTITATTTGKIGGGLVFSPGTDRIGFSNNSSLDNIQQKTIETWIKVPDQGGNGVIIAKIDDSDTDPGWWLRLRSDEQIAYRHRFSGGFSWWEYDTSLTIGDWYHVALTYDYGSTSPAIFINGSNVSVLEGAAKSGDNNDDSSELITIGNSISGADDFEGVIGDLKISNSLRSANWIQTSYNNQNDPSSFFATQAEEVGPGPVGYWSFDEGYGTTVHDESSNKNDGTFIGAEWKNESECVVGSCLYFNGGSSQEITVPNSDSLNPSIITMSVWVKRISTTSLYPIMLSKENYSGGSGYNFGDLQNSANAPYGFRANGVTGLSTEASENTAIFNDWNYYAAVFDGDKSKLYLNGTMIAESDPSFSAIISNTQVLKIGVNSHFNGYIDEIKIYPYARTADQIKQDYNAGLAGVKSNSGVSASFGSQSDKWMSDGLVGYWKMDESATTSGAVDSSGNGNDGTYYGDASTTAGKFGNGGSFDGSGDYVNCGTDTSLKLSNSFTLATWVNFDVNDQTMMITSSQSGEKSNYQMWYSTDRLKVTFRNSQDTAWKDHEYIWNPTVGTWYHFVGMFDDTADRMRLYINGDEVIDEIETDIPYSSGEQATAIGYNNGNSAWYFDGKLDEVRIYNRALFPSEVKKLYQWAPGPVAHWKFDEKSGTTAYDCVASSSTAGGNDGAISGATWARGKYGGALSFDGSNNYVGIGNPSVLDFTTNNFSLSLWFKATEGDTIRTLISKADGFVKWQALYIWNNDSLYWFSDDDTDNAEIIISGDYDDQKWYHVEIVRNSTNYNFYLNGVLKGTSLNNGDISNSDNWIIGSRDDGDNDMIGSIDDVRIYNYARTQKQILEDMNGGGPAAKSPIFHLNFDEGYGGNAHDSSIYGNDGLLYPGTTGDNTSSSSMWTKDGRVKGAMEFDGTDDYVDISGATLITTGNPFTVTTWLYPYTNALDDNRVFLNLETESGDDISFLLRDMSDNAIAIYKEGTSNNKNHTINTDYADIREQWIHFVAVNDGTHALNMNGTTIYINGKELAATTFSSLWTVYNQYIGWSGWDGGGDFYSGLIDGLKVYNYALTEDEIKTEYNSGQATVMGTDASRDNDGTTVTGANRDYCIPGDTAACSSPIIEYKMDEKKGVTVYDTSGNGDDGALGGGTINLMPSWTRGIYGAGLEFDGTDDAVALPEISSMTDYSIEIWYKPNETINSSNTGKNTLYSALSDANPDIYIYHSATDNGKLNYRCFTPTGFNLLTTTDTWNAGEWYHVAATYTNTGTRKRIYVNGVLENTQIATCLFTAPDVYHLIGTGNYYTDGVLDDFKLYNYERTPAQIAWDYNRGKPIAHWKFDECLGGTIHDSSSNGNHGQLYLGNTGITATGTCASSSDSFWYNGQSGAKKAGAYFDGEDDYIDIGDTSLNINSISFWLKQNYTDADIIDLDNGTHTITLSDSHVTASGFSSPTIYVNGVPDSAIPNNGWQYILVTTATAIDANNMDIGRISTDYFSGQLDEIKLWTYPLNAEQAKTDYSGGAISFGSTPNQNGSVLTSSWTCGDDIYNDNDAITYFTVLADDGNCWLASNLGTANIASSYDDSSAYGAYYQWGRGADGHQISTSDTTAVLSSTDDPGHGDFITIDSGLYDWRSPQNDNLWDGVDGTNNPCPTGWRIPTQTEWATVVSAESITNYTTAYSSSLKLTAAGVRNRSASLDGQGSGGSFWSSSPYGISAYLLLFSSGVNPAYNFNRAYGLSVRCFKN